MSIIIFLLVLFVLVLVHEWGHFIVAKKTGMRVDEFGIGFPPKLFSLKKGETEYSFNLLPVGGFVRIFGENPEETDAASSDASRAFSARPKWAQALVLVAGVAMNVLFAWFLFTTTYLIGVPTPVSDDVASESAKLYIAGVLPDSPADGVIPSGAEILSIADEDETIAKPSPTVFSQFISERAPDPVTIVFTHNHKEERVSLAPVTGLVADNKEQYLIGTSLTYVEIQKQSFFSAIGSGFTTSLQGLSAITVGLLTLIKDTFVGQADFSSVTGPVGIVGLVGDAAAFGFTTLLTFTAIISLNLAVVNLLPFPALDGGRLLFVVLEAIARKNIPAVWATRANLVGFTLLMLLMVAVTYNDIVKLL
ncbi:MAG: site-2 protease family protein [Patescibacteria group bacterium]